MKRIYALLLIPILAWLLFACENNSSVGGEGKNENPSGFAISPRSEGLAAGDNSAVFNLIGGDEPIMWSVSDPSLGMVNETDGRTVTYTRANSNAVEGVNVITAIDSKGNRAEANITLNSLVISPSAVSLRDGDSSAGFSVVGGSEPFSWSVSDDSLGRLSSTSGRTVTYIVDVIPDPIISTNGVTIISNAVRNVVNTINVRDRRGAKAAAVIDHQVLE